MRVSTTNGTSGSQEVVLRQTPPTGDEYLASLRDGRLLWVHHEKVSDPTSHPALRNAARMIARLYDALHDPARREKLVTRTDTGSGGFTHRFYVAPRSVDDLVGARAAIAEWAHITYGWMGQSPDEGASILGALASPEGLSERFAPNALAWYRKASEEAAFFHHALREPKSRAADQRETPLHVERETDRGLVLSGATVVPVCAALSRGGFFMKDGILPSAGEERSLAFVVPMATPGLALHFRPTSATATRVYGNPFDYPLTSRLEENDAVLTFDHIEVPWENVFVYGDLDPEGLAALRARFFARASFQESTRLSVKLELVTGLLLRSVEAAGTRKAPEVVAAIGEILSYRNLFWGMTEAQARAPVRLSDGTLLPNPDHGLSYRIFSKLAYPRIRDAIERTVGSGHVYLSANASDFSNPETRAYLERFVRGENGYTAIDRVKLTKLLWDALGTEMGGRFDGTGGSRTADDLRSDVLAAADASGLAEACKGFSGRCLDEYDLEGWRVRDLYTPVEPAPAVSSRRRTTW